jgi:hypothetical protein
MHFKGWLTNGCSLSGVPSDSIGLSQLHQIEFSALRWHREQIKNILAIGTLDAVYVDNGHRAWIVLRRGLVRH